MTDRPISRRRVLQGGTAITTAALAGCSSVTSLLGGGGGRPYLSWLAAPDELDMDHYRFRYFKPATWQEYEDDFDEAYYEQFAGYFSGFVGEIGLDLDETESVMFPAFGQVISHTAGQDTVVEELEDRDFEENGEHEGYTIYTLQSEEFFESSITTVGVSGNAVVRAGGTSTDAEWTSTEIVESIIDAKAGEVDRYHQENDDFDRVTSAVSTGALTTATTQEEVDDGNPVSGVFENQVARGSSLSLGSDTSHATAVRVLADSDDTDRDAAEEWMEDGGGFDDDLQDRSLSINGRVIKVTGTIKTDDLGGN
ncbi:MAG: hypothetical protein ABEJ30_02340 [Halorientalis sp.]